MNVQEAILKRRSIRKFKDKPISAEDIEKLIEALRWAPSARNLQSRYFYFVYNEETKEKIAEAAFSQKSISEAPLAIIVCAQVENIKPFGEMFGIIDASVSIENLFLQATELGLGTVWCGALNSDEIAKILDLPKNLKVIGVVPVGYPNEEPKPTPRKNNDEILKIIK